MIDLFPQLEKAAVVSGHDDVCKREFCRRRAVSLLRIVPDHQPSVIDLLNDQLKQIFRDNGHRYFTKPFYRSCLPMEDHSYLPSRSSSQYFLASFHGTSSWSGAMFRTTPSLRSGSR